jgi:H+/Na+-translocating ferredoxin:NAD+ oxidoreductase subunit B
MITALASLTTLGLTLGWLLGLAARYFKVEGSPLQKEVEPLFPGSQCGQCGYPGCSAAAAAVVAGEAPVTLCPPGGRTLAESLAAKLGFSVDLSGVADKPPMYAHVREALCVGCTKCFKRCPTDAIIGGPKQIHAVLMDACTGCEQCFEVCPTECIEMRPVQPTLQSWYWPMPASAA